MMTTMAVATALLAVLVGVLLAAFELPRADADRLTQRLSVMLLIATSATAVAGAAYAIFA